MRPSMATASPFFLFSATASARPLHTTTVKKSAPESLPGLPTAKPNFATGVPSGVCAISGSAARLPARFTMLMLAIVSSVLSSFSVPRQCQGAAPRAPPPGTYDVSRLERDVLPLLLARLDPLSAALTRSRFALAVRSPASEELDVLGGNGHLAPLSSASI